MKNTGIIFILFTSNNVLCSLTDIKGNLISWTSAGSQRSKGLKKSIPIVVYSAITKLANIALSQGVSHMHIKFKGLSKSKKSILKALNHSNIKLLSIQDVTALPHNGCKNPRKKRL